MSETLLTTLDHGVMTLTLNRPDVFNSFNQDMGRAFQAALDDAANNGAVRCVVITGEGRAFCAGQDLKEVTSEASPGFKVIVEETYNRSIRRICDMEKPVVAAVNGVAAGAGANIALACDFVVAKTSVKFIQAFANIGLIPDSGGTFWLPRLVGMARATELLMFGEVFDAARALELGFVNRVEEDGPAALALATEWAQKLARGPQFAHRMTKRMLEQEHGMSLRDAMEAEAQAQAICMQHPDFRTAHDAFKRKERPVFEGAEICDD